MNQMSSDNTNEAPLCSEISRKAAFESSGAALSGNPPNVAPEISKTVVSAVSPHDSVSDEAVTASNRDDLLSNPRSGEINLTLNSSDIRLLFQYFNISSASLVDRGDDMAFHRVS